MGLLIGSAINSSTNAGNAGSAIQPRKPNIVFIMADDLGPGDVGAYGQKLIKTPNIDRLAAEGTRFTQVYAGGAVCAPSRSVLMTGLHTGHTTVRANTGAIPIWPEDITVAEVLKQAGYATGGFGKWGLGDAGSVGVPSKQGFDYFFGYLHQVHAHTYYTDFLWENEQKVPLPGNLEGKNGQYSADLIAEEALRFVRQHKDRPFFLYAAFTLPHGRFVVPSDEPYSGMDWSQLEKNLAAMITRMDGQIGKLMELLKELRLDNNTIVFFTSDHGAPPGPGRRIQLFRSNGGLRGAKGNLYEGGIRVPMIVRWPGRVAAGAVSDLQWAFWDFMPTAAALAGTKAPANIDGISVLPELLGTKAAKRKPQPERLFYWEHHQFDRQTAALRQSSMIQAARLGDWKAVRVQPGAPLELYNLRDDVGETTNVAAKYPEVIARIESQMKTARTEPRPQNTGSMEYKR